MRDNDDVSLGFDFALNIYSVVFSLLNNLKGSINDFTDDTDLFNSEILPILFNLKEYFIVIIE